MRKFLLFLSLLLLPLTAHSQLITSLSPNFSPATASSYTVTVSGTGFINGATVLWGGVPLQTTFVNSQQLTAIVPCCFSYGVSTIYVTVTLPSGDTSAPVVFRNFGQSAPITSYTPTVFHAGVGVSLKVNGNYFTGGSQIYFDNVSQNTTFVSQYQLTANLSGGSVDSRHRHSVSVRYPPVLSVRTIPNTQAFNNVLVGTSATESISVANIAGTILNISVTTLSGPSVFGETHTCSTTVPPYSGCSFTIIFTPDAVGTFSGQITIVSNGVGSPTIIGLTGTAIAPTPPPVPPLGPGTTFSPASLMFASTAVGSSTAPQTVTLTNSGGSALTITAVILAGAASGSYAISDGCVAASPLAVSASCSVTGIIFTPLSAGNLNATINFSDSAAGSPQKIPLAGIGTTSPAHDTTLAWTASVSGVNGYNVYRGTVSGGPYTQINGSLISGTAYTDFAIVSGGHYCYVATAVALLSSITESVHSNESCVTIP